MKSRAKRPKAVLRLKVVGPEIQPGRIPIPELLAICAQAQEAVNRQAAALRGRPGVRPGPKPTPIKETCTLELFSIGRGSAVMSFARPEPKPQPQGTFDLPLEELGESAVRAVAKSIRSAGTRRGKARGEMDDGVKQSLQEMGKLFGNGVRKIEWIVPGDRRGHPRIAAHFDDSVLAKIDRKPTGRAQDDISMDGRLEMADFKIGDRKCLIHTAKDQRVHCTFPPEMEDEVQAALRRVVRVKGLGTFVQPSNRIESIALRSVQVLNPLMTDGADFFAGLNLAQLTAAQGVDPRLDARQLRGAWPKDEDVEAFLATIDRDRP